MSALRGPIVRRLRSGGHDVTWIRESTPGLEDEAVLARSYDQERILLTQDWGFGELTVGLRKPTVGIVIVSTPFIRGRTRGGRQRWSRGCWKSATARGIG